MTGRSTSKSSELCNNHKDFISIVRRCLSENEENGWLCGIKVFKWEKRAGAESCHQWVGVAFRMAKSVSYFACNAMHFDSCSDNYRTPFVIQTHYNEDFVSQMAEML